METLKIGFFCWESLYSERVGGLARAATHLAENLAKNHEVHFFTRGDGDCEINGVNYHYCHPRGENIVDYCRDMSLKMVERFWEFDSPEFDILHFHDWHVVEAMHILRDRNTVFTYHSTEYGRNGDKFGDWWEFKEISGKEWYAGLIAKKITTVSNTLKNEVMWLYNIPDSKVAVVPNGVNPEEFYADVEPEEVKREYGVHPYDPLVFFAGRLVYQKGPDLLVGAIPHVLSNRRDVEFIFAGDGDMRRWLEERTNGQPTKFLGHLPDSEFIKLLNASDIVVVPSRNEPFGLVLLEAWSAERCVVATDVGGLSENIENFVDGIKVYVNPESIAWGINYVINDPYGIRVLGRRGREKVENFFRWKVVADCMLDVYENCCLEV
ncbi:glycosyltransferase family 4 protein [Archaeoglobus veneficus]|uniref:Glycosyl transferase group 1 n=1 Tax=Archaeoglobus veneficus (strain DSM 11195 / SNP6) TaxID=693661 RepID=F2KMN0_ARCVS|nr:glycosyltransferase family 4 protein [Archaeoglobus veneficus]AEA47227.1 glycosyl transferase group 1 [Archaeoglobus veneficus SNP6]